MIVVMLLCFFSLSYILFLLSYGNNTLIDDIFDVFLLSYGNNTLIDDCCNVVMFLSLSYIWRVPTILW